MRYGDRIRLAHIIGVIDEEGHGLLQEMADWRNDVAHTPWMDIGEQEQAQIKSAVEWVHEYLGTLLEEVEESFEEIEESGQIDDFDLGFGGHSVDQQALQLAIFTVLNARGGTTTLGAIQDIVEDEPGRIETRCHRMRSVGYVEMDGGEVRLTDDGWAFVGNEL